MRGVCLQIFECLLDEILATAMSAYEAGFLEMVNNDCNIIKDKSPNKKI